MGKSWDWHWNSTTVDAQKSRRFWRARRTDRTSFSCTFQSGFGLIQYNLLKLWIHEVVHSGLSLHTLTASTYSLIGCSRTSIVWRVSLQTALKNPRKYRPFLLNGAAYAGCQGWNGVSWKWEWIGDPADILTGFTGVDGQQYGAHLLEFPERKVSVVFTCWSYIFFFFFYWLLDCRFELEVSSPRTGEKKTPIE